MSKFSSSSLSRIKIHHLLLVLILWILLAPVFVFIIPGFFLTMVLSKWLINFIVHLVHPDFVPLDPLDIACSIFNFSEKKIYSSNIGFVLTLDSDVDRSQIYSDFSEYILNVKVGDSFKFDRLRKTAVKFLAHFYWKELNEPSLKKCIKEREVVSKTDLKCFLSSWLDEGYDEGGALWEIIIYKDTDEFMGKSVLAFKMSHALGDGITIQKIAQELVGPKVEHTKIGPSKSIELTTSQIIRAGILSPLTLLSQAAPVLFHSDPISKCEKKSKMLLTFVNLDSNSVRKLAHGLNCKFNDILMSLFSNVVRDFILEENSVQKLPRVIPIVSPREIFGRNSVMRNRLTVTIHNVEVNRLDRVEKMRVTGLNSSEDFYYGTHIALYYLLQLIYYLPSFLLVKNSPIAMKSGVCSSVSSYPIPNFLVDSQQVFGKYKATSYYPLQGLFLKDFGFTSTFITRDNGIIEATISANAGLIKTEDSMIKFGDKFRKELQAMSQDFKDSKTEIC